DHHGPATSLVPNDVGPFTVGQVLALREALVGTQGAEADVAGADAEGHRDHGERVVHDLEADRVVLASDDHDERDPDVERPGTQRDQEPGHTATHAPEA